MNTTIPNADDVETIRARVKALSDSRQLSDLSRLSGVSYGWICHFTRGRYKNPGVLTLNKIVSALSDLNRAAA